MEAAAGEVDHGVDQGGVVPAAERLERVHGMEQRGRSRRSRRPPERSREEPPSAGEEPGGVAGEVQQRSVIGDEQHAASMSSGRKVVIFHGRATFKPLQRPFSTGCALQQILKTL